MRIQPVQNFPISEVEKVTLILSDSLFTFCSKLVRDYNMFPPFAKCYAASQVPFQQFDHFLVPVAFSQFYWGSSKLISPFCQPPIAWLFPADILPS